MNNMVIIGANSSLAREIIKVIEEEHVNISELILLDDKKNTNRSLSFNDDIIDIVDIDSFEFEDIDIVIFAGEKSQSTKYSKEISSKVKLVFDASGYNSLKSAIPLISYKVNHEEKLSLALHSNKNNLLSIPCPTVSMIGSSLKMLNDVYILKSVVINACYSSSDISQEAMDELFKQTKGIYTNEPLNKTKKIFEKQIAFNVIPKVENFLGNGYTEKELQVVKELRKLFSNEIDFSCNGMYVSSFVGLGCFINVELDNATTFTELKNVFQKDERITIIDHRQGEGYVSLIESIDESLIYISRIKVDDYNKKKISFWIVGDHLHMGSAQNVIDLLQYMHLKKIR